MEFQSDIVDGVATLRLEGPLTFEVHTPFRAHVQRLLAVPGLRRMVVDLSEVRQMDYSSMGLLLLVREMAEKRGARLALARPSPQVRELLEAFHFTRIFDQEP